MTEQDETMAEHPDGLDGWRRWCAGLDVAVGVEGPDVVLGLGPVLRGGLRELLERAVIAPLLDGRARCSDAGVGDAVVMRAFAVMPSLVGDLSVEWCAAALALSADPTANFEAQWGLDELEALDVETLGLVVRHGAALFDAVVAGPVADEETLRGIAGVMEVVRVELERRRAVEEGGAGDAG